MVCFEMSKPTVDVKLNPNLKKDVMKAVDEKVRSILSIRCVEHNQTPRLGNSEGKLRFETCCEALDKQVSEAMK